MNLFNINYIFVLFLFAQFAIILLFRVRCECFTYKVIAHLWPVIGRATTVVRREVLYLFPFGLASYLWGTLFIDRSNPKNALNQLSVEAKSINDHGCKLLLFPEGTRHQGDKLLEFKKGAFHIAVQSQSLLQPVIVSKYTFLDSFRSFGRGKFYT